MSPRTRAIPLVVGLVVAAAGCVRETPERAIYSLAHDVEHEAVDGACQRIYPAEDLPRVVRGALSLPADDAKRTGASFDCRRAFDGDGPLRSFEFEEPRVRSTRTLDVAPRTNIVAVAEAYVAIDGERPVNIALVKTDRWRVVVDVEGGRVVTTGQRAARFDHDLPASVDRRTRPSSSET